MSFARTVRHRTEGIGLFQRLLTGAAILCMAAASPSCSRPQPLAPRPQTVRPTPQPLKAPVPLFEEDAREEGTKERAPAVGETRIAGEEVLPTPRTNPGGASLPASTSPVSTSWKEPEGKPESVRDDAIRPAGPEPAAKPPAARETEGLATTRTAGREKNRLEELFEEYRKRFEDGPAADPDDPYVAIERADIEAKLIALFFLRDERKLEDYRELIRAFRDEKATSVELEYLRAALYQRLGQADMRDKAIERAARGTSSAAGGLKVAGLTFAREIRGYRSYVPVSSADFAAGEEVLLYGEIEGFRSTSVPRPNAGPGMRRSFAAELVLHDQAGEEADRRVLLKAGAAIEVVDDASKPVHFWGRYALPAHLAPGSYRLEVEVRDLEGQKRTKAAIPLKVKGLSQ
jgi:hypothetical protein